jgi:HJR/Mrr/RecB family endonuclease
MNDALVTKAQKRYDEFKEHGLSHDKALSLLRLMYELKPRGFEEYVRRYFFRVYGIKSKVTWWYTDGGVDIVAIYNQSPLLVQCKKRASWHIKKSQILEFWHNVQHHPEYTEWTRAVLITTNRVSNEAKNVANEYNISIRDYSHLLTRQKQYSLDMFAQEVKKNNKYFCPFKLNYRNSILVDTAFEGKSIWMFLYNLFVK